MPTYDLVDGGVTVKGQMRFTSFSENVQAGELGQLIRFPAYTFENSQMYAIRKSGLGYVGLGVIEDFPLVGGHDVKLWSPTMFIPVSMYYPEASTLLYFPVKSSIPAGTEWQIFRVFA